MELTFNDLLAFLTLILGIVIIISKYRLEYRRGATLLSFTPPSEQVQTIKTKKTSPHPKRIGKENQSSPTPEKRESASKDKNGHSNKKQRIKNKNIM